MIGSAELALMKPSAYVIAVSRGGVVDEKALIAALRDGTIAGAGVDVFDPEPAEANNPLFGLDNVVVTPHIAGGTRESFYKLSVAVTEQMIEVLEGHRADNVVNPEIWNRYVARWFGERG
jgi:phosphoglycerate dehydrogenase-like enzyme